MAISFPAEWLSRDIDTDDGNEPLMFLKAFSAVAKSLGRICRNG